jgi:ParB/RepB/Spo0J family partition protein
MKRIEVPIVQLIVNPAINPRHGVDDDVSDLVAQIRANGFSDALWVRLAPSKPAKGKGKGKPKKSPSLYEVIDGSRRLRALRLVAADLKLKTVPCDVIEADDAKARELALAANVARSNLSPADEAQAFAALKLGGLPVSTIAARFAVPERRVQQRIALGTLAPVILDALRIGKIGIETAQAFTRTPARDRQEKLFTELEKKGQLHRHAINEALDGKGSVRATEGRARLVGIEAYAKAGGAINEDLFGDRTSLSNEKLLDKLFAERIEELVKQHKAEGWSWVKLLHEKGYSHTAYKYAKVEPKGTREESGQEKRARMELEAQHKALSAEYDALEDAEEFSPGGQERYDELRDVLEELDRKIAALKAAPFTPAQKAKLGVIIHVTDDDCEILLGRKTPEEARSDEKSASKKRAAKERAIEDAEEDDGMARTPREPEGLSYSEVVKQLLLVAARNDCKTALTQKPALAARLGLAHRISDVILENYGAPFVSIRETETGGEKFTAACEITAAIFKGCESFASIVAKLETLDAETIGTIDAVVTASLLRFGSLADADVRAVMAMIDPEIGMEGFKVDGDFLARLNREQLSLIAVECGKDVPKGKKPDMIAALLPMISEAGWLPAQLRTPSYRGPGSENFQPAENLAVECVTEVRPAQEEQEAA